jgi:hypothetical protein
LREYGRILKPSGILIILIFFLGGQCEYAAESPGKGPVLIELFTSEGCSSCPPADALLEKIDASQPFDGTPLVVLSEHVDYWDHDGWKDPYSSHSLTERQGQYVRSFGLSTAYTPQMVLDGSRELFLNAPQQIGPSIEKAAQTPKVTVQIDSIRIEAGQPDILRGRIEVINNLHNQGGDIYVATALDHANSQVLHGENGGRHLTHVAVVQNITRIGRLEKEKGYDGNFQVELKPGTDPANLRIIVFVQEAGVGRVLGVAMEKGVH